MQAITFYGRRDLRLETLPDPQPGPGEVRVRVTDTLLAQALMDLNLEGHFADLSVPHPRTGIGLGLVLGQQFGGVIDAVGPGVAAARVGEQVGVAPGVGCGTCASCRAGYVNHCPELSYYGLLGAHGGLAGWCVVRAECAVPVPRRGLGHLLEGLLVVHGQARKAQPWMSDAPVLCLGAGPVGLSAASLLRDLYGQRVLVHDVLPGRLERAAAIGYELATAEDLQKTFRLVLDCAGTNPETGGSALQDGLARVAKGGALVAVGTYLHEVTIAPMDLLFREVTLSTSFAYTAEDVAMLVPRLGELHLPLEDITERMDLQTAFTEGLLRGEVDRDGFTLLVVEP